jgi:hypothetical protein
MKFFLVLIVVLLLLFFTRSSKTKSTKSTKQKSRGGEDDESSDSLDLTFNNYLYIIHKLNNDLPKNQRVIVSGQGLSNKKLTPSVVMFLHIVKARNVLNIIQHKRLTFTKENLELMKNVGQDTGFIAESVNELFYKRSFGISLSTGDHLVHNASKLQSEISQHLLEHLVKCKMLYDYLSEDAKKSIRDMDTNKNGKVDVAERADYGNKRSESFTRKQQEEMANDSIQPNDFNFDNEQDRLEMMLEVIRGNDRFHDDMDNVSSKLVITEPKQT